MDNTKDIFVWSDSYSVGNPTLDAQHQRLLSVCRQLDEIFSRPAENRRVLLEVLLTELMELSLEHFQTEQRILESIDYAAWDDEAREHEAFIGDLTAMLNQVRSDAPVSGSARISLSGAMIDHLLHSDSRYKPYLAYSLA